MNKNLKRVLLASVSLFAVVLLTVAVIIAPDKGSIADGEPDLTMAPGWGWQNDANHSGEADLNGGEVSRVERITAIDVANRYSGWYFEWSESDLSGIAGNTDLIIRGTVVGYEVYRSSTSEPLPIIVAIVNVDKVISRTATEAPLLDGAASNETEHCSETEVRSAVSSVETGDEIRVFVMGNIASFELRDGNIVPVFDDEQLNYKDDSEMIMLLSYDRTDKSEGTAEFALQNPCDYSFVTDENDEINAELFVGMWQQILENENLNGNVTAEEISTIIINERLAHSDDVPSYGFCDFWGVSD